MGKVMVTNLKSKDNLQKAVLKANPDEIIIVSTKKTKYRDFEVKSRYLKVKDEFEDVPHKLNEILKSTKDIIIIVKPDSIGTYILWLAEQYPLNHAFIISHEEIQQIHFRGCLINQNPNKNKLKQDFQNSKNFDCPKIRDFRRLIY